MADQQPQINWVLPDANAAVNPQNLVVRRLYDVRDAANARNAEQPWMVGLGVMELVPPEEHAAVDILFEAGAAPNPQEWARLYGAANARGIVHDWVATDPLFLKLRTFHSGFHPFNMNWDSHILPITGYIFSHFRARQVGRNDPSVRIALAVGETYSPRIPAQILGNQLESHQAYQAIRDQFRDADGVNQICDPNDRTYQQFVANEQIRALFPNAEDFAQWPPTAEEVGRMTAVSVAKILYYLSHVLRADYKKTYIELLTTSYLSLAKRGSVSEDCAGKVIQAVQEELQVQIRLDFNAMQMIYRHFQIGVTPENAAEVFGTYLHNLPDVALRLRLILMQAAFSGLTCFVLIGRALRLYPTFYWTDTAHLLPGQFENFAQARARVAGNPYYGFARELGPVKSTKYKGLAYVAVQLLRRIAGERSLARYAGIGPNTPIPNKARLDELIAEYVEHYYDVPGENADGEEIIPRAQAAEENLPQRERRLYRFARSCNEDMFVA
jgi:hypothetical protein